MFRATRAWWWSDTTGRFSTTCTTLSTPKATLTKTLLFAGEHMEYTWWNFHFLISSSRSLLTTVAVNNSFLPSVSQQLFFRRLQSTYGSRHINTFQKSTAMPPLSVHFSSGNRDSNGKRVAGNEWPGSQRGLGLRGFQLKTAQPILPSE